MAPTTAARPRPRRPRPRRRAEAHRGPQRGPAVGGPGPHRHLRGGGGDHRLRVRLPRPAVRRRPHAHRRRGHRPGPRLDRRGQPGVEGGSPHLRAVPARDPGVAAERGAHLRGRGLRAVRSGRPAHRRRQQRGVGPDARGRDRWPRGQPRSCSSCCATARRTASRCAAPTSTRWPTPPARSASSWPRS